MRLHLRSLAAVTAPLSDDDLRSLVELLARLAQPAARSSRREAVLLPPRQVRRPLPVPHRRRLVVITVVCVSTLPGSARWPRTPRAASCRRTPEHARGSAAQPLSELQSRHRHLVASRSGSPLTASDKLVVTSLLAKIKELPNVVTARPRTSSDGEATQA